MRNFIALTLVGALAGVPASAQDEAGTPSTESTVEATPDEATTEEARRERGLVGKILLYLPNRIFDLTDIVRARVRVAPGFAVQARATRLVSANVGLYGGIYAGPRGKRRVPWPGGFESLSGVSASVAQVGTEGPSYGPSEMGAGFQALLVGADRGIAPEALLAFFTGNVGWDFRKDDL